MPLFKHVELLRESVSRAPPKEVQGAWDAMAVAIAKDYIGVVRYRDVLYPGKHDRLVEPETWHEVQKLLSAKNYAGESSASTLTT